MKTTVYLLITSLMIISGSLAQASGGSGGHHNTNMFPKPQANSALASRLPMVEILDPKPLATISGTQVTLKWTAVEGADSYRVQVATDPTFKWLIKQEDFYKGTTLDVGGLEAGKSYFWRVYSWKTNNDPSWISSFAKVSSFSVK